MSTIPQSTLKVFQKPPLAILLPPLLLPSIRPLGIKVHHIQQRRVMGKNDKHILSRVKVRHPPDAVHDESDVAIRRFGVLLVEGLVSGVVRMDLVYQDFSWEAGAWEEGGVGEGRWADGLGEREVLCRPEGAAVVEGVGAEEDEGIRRSPG